MWFAFGIDGAVVEIIPVTAGIGAFLEFGRPVDDDGADCAEGVAGFVPERRAGDEVCNE